MYQDTPFNPAPYTSSIGDLMLRSAEAPAHAAEIIGQAQARAAELRGQAWAGAARAIGAAPGQAIQTENATVDQKLKQQALEETIAQRREADRVRTVQTVGRLAAMTSDPNQFAAALDDQVKGGGLQADTAAHIKQQLATAAQSGDPDAWRGLRNQYITFADSYTQAVKLGQGDQMVRPSLDPTRPATVVAEGRPKLTPLRPNETLVAEGSTPNGQPTASPVMTAPGVPGQGDYTLNGQRFHADGTPIGDAVPLQEKPGEADERAARVQLLTRQIAEADQKINGTEPMSPKDRAELEIQRQHLNLQRTSEEIRQKREDPASPQNQEKLEQAYRSLAQTVVRSRSGQLGVEDQKVGTAKHLLTLFEQARQPDGTYNLARIQRRELATGLAKLMSPTGNIGENQINELDQKTAQGSIADLVTYLGGDPKAVNATPGGVATLLRDSILRQGRQAEQNREHELDFIRQSRPTDLDPKRAVGIENGLGGLNRIDDVLKGGRDTRKPGKIYAKDPNGVLHEADPGTALPAGWVRQQ